MVGVAMSSYVVRRMVLFLPTLLLVSLIVFVVMRIMPGDPALLILLGEGEGTYTQQELDNLRRKLGTDRPLHEQYATWIWGVAHGDLGRSLWDNTLVIREIQDRLPVTLQLAAMAIVIGALVAVPLGILSAVKQDSWIDNATRVFTIFGVAAPPFWVAILTIVFLAKVFHWLPPLDYARPWVDPWRNLQQLIFPTLVLAYYEMAFLARVTRSATLEVLREDYVRTARAKGVMERFVLFRHVLANCILPVLTVSSWQFGRLMGGAVLIEAIFLVPGTGSLLIDSLYRRDFPIIQALILLAAVVVLASNLIVDLFYGFLDPRIRYSEA